MAIGDPSIASVRPEQITVYAVLWRKFRAPNVFVAPSKRYLLGVCPLSCITGNGQTIIADKTAASGASSRSMTGIGGMETENSVVLQQPIQIHMQAIDLG
jgi:hypothetical protein